MRKTDLENRIRAIVPLNRLKRLYSKRKRGFGQNGRGLGACRTVGEKWGGDHTPSSREGLGIENLTWMAGKPPRGGTSALISDQKNRKVEETKELKRGPAKCKRKGRSHKKKKKVK